MPTVTHYIRYDEPGVRLRRALCGTYVDPRAHDNVPTCRRCYEALMALEAADPR